MILYNVTINIEKAVAGEWLKWMKEVHIPKIMNTGMFMENKIFRLLHEEENGGITYAVQFYASSMENIQNYQINYAPALQAEHNERYADQFVEFMTLLEAEKL
ncbi:DUF4286 family protein [soil metagenome]